jgi:hypothetical protein|tara:strand:- start:86 stop:334 length:249 start_codon:yes stop_codon:yes gene_type:complete
VDLQCGDLIRWVYDYNIYAAYDDGVVGYDPIHRHGIIMEVSHMDPNHLVVFCLDCVEINWMLVNVITDEVEILSRGCNEYDE